MSARTYLARRARQTGRVVIVAHADDLGIERNGVQDWWTLCDEHGFLVQHATLAAARFHAADPLGWCEHCCDEAADEVES